MSEIQQSKRQSLSTNLGKVVQSQIAGWSRSDLSGYTYEQTRSHYPTASSDYSVFDTSGKLVLLGRGFGGQVFFWTPTVDPRLA